MNDSGAAYTLAMWRVKEGREEEFVDAWRGELAEFFLSLPNPPGTGALIRSVQDPQLFYSFGPWRSLDDVHQMRSHPRTAEVMGKLRGLCEEVKAGDFSVVLTVPGEENKALARRAVEELFNRGNLEAADELFAPDYILHDLASPEGEVHGPEGFKHFVGVFRTAFPNLHVTIEDQIAEGDKMVTRYTVTGNHLGDLMGLPPSGKRVTIVGAGVSRASGGKFVETWDHYDALDVCCQVLKPTTP